MGLLSSSKSSQNQITATDRGRVLSGAASRFVESGFMVGDKSQYTEAGAISLAPNSRLQLAPDLSKGNFSGANVQIGDPGLSQSLVRTLGDLASRPPAPVSVVSPENVTAGVTSPESPEPGKASGGRGVWVMVGLVFVALLVWIWRRA